MTIEIKAGVMHIAIPMTDPTLSSTGKSYSVATTHGYVDAGVRVNGKPVKININAIVPVKG